MSRRFFTTSAAAHAIKRIIGYPIEKLEPQWRSAVETYKNNGAKERTGQDVKAVLINCPADGSSPVHTSRYNPSDKREIISAKMKLADGTIAPGTHHIFVDGKGTSRKGQTPK
ncbi:hypothetical protein FPSE_10063 [Fusarium pseudograminearum CS3096]|uniref:Uncharacterized protein n=1 Tax=Fusarium pseudograminearum (strain CS3096) TaxID=1028729 RepID=K3V878_FUSPC|nr:hypothetical protein FPSE_10063 [Fusarium pseudograminearum CS3096]EKJ69747.1 hypothetical protein FPSE_10063 [Fusarium pseudograminearum CS3096]